MKKKLLSLGVAVLLAGAASAQVSYGVKAGVNLAKVSGYEGFFADIQKANTSFFVTSFADIPVAPNFSVQPGLSLQGKGSKTDYTPEDHDGSGMDVNMTGSTNVMSIEIPINAVYYIPTGETGSVFFGAGPYAGYNISGKVKGKSSINEGGTSINTESEESIKFSGDDRHINAFDFGVNFIGGYKLSNGLIINAGYGLGLTDLRPNKEGNSIHGIYNNGRTNSVSNRVIRFGVGFQF